MVRVLPTRNKWIICALGTVLGGMLVSGLSGCARNCPPRKVVTATLPGPAPADEIPDALLRRGGTQNEWEDCACTLEHRVNLCITVNGSSTLSPNSLGLSFARIREGGAADTLSVTDVSTGARCFGEWRGLQRVLMLRDTAVLDSSGWFEVQTVDCCHGEAKTIDFVK